MKRLAGLLAAAGLAAAAVAEAASPDPRAGATVDHLILGIRDLDEGVREFEERTGVRPVVGGEHPGRGTRNALVSLGAGHYVEILAPQVNAPESERVTPLRALSKLTAIGWALSVTDVESARRLLEQARLRLSPVQPGARARPDGTRLTWQTFEVTSPAVAGVPFFIRWGDGTRHPSQDSPKGCTLDRLRAVSPDAEDLRRVLTTLGVDVPVAHGPAGLDLALACRKGIVPFSAAAAPSSPR